ncbi:GntR family transcriptional regulator [Bacillus sp. JJ1503]|uniref:GntR family transcriptional regulator n=1 Tax=unclassified Bacillus (in: firmicutes) TaxID=185979 RepID=UPI002FFFD946
MWGIRKGERVISLYREPLHYQIRKILRQRINDGVYQNMLPGELDLMKEFSVSRATIREAISGCVQEGLLVRIQGKGTFVSKKPVQDWLGYLYGFSETMEELGFNPTAKVIKSSQVEDSEISKILKTDNLYLIERLRLINGEPIALEITYFPYEIGIRMADNDNLVFYSFIEQELGITLERAEQSISAMVATQNEAKHLNISVGHPLLNISRVTYSDRDELIQVARIIYRGDQYKLNIDLKRSKKS